MGKRELVLIAVFVVVGIAVYQFTAPPAPTGSDLSVGGIFQAIRRGMRGPRESVTSESTRTFPIASGVGTLRLNISRPSDLTITAEDREDVSVTIKATARGYDVADTRATAAGAQLAFSTSGDTVVATNQWTDRRDGQHAFVTQVALTLAIPRRLQVGMLPHVGLLTVKNVAGFDAAGSRGETRVTGTTGDVRLTHAGGTLEIAGGRSLKLSARNSRGEISGITGAVSIDATASRLRLSDLTGPIELDSRNTDFAIEKIEALKPPFRFTGTGGALRVDGLRAEAHIDGHNTDLDVRMAAPAPVTIENVGAITLTAPAGGYTLDAVATEGRITSDDSAITATPSDGPDARVGAKIRGGGPALTLRATRGRIEIRRGTAGK